MRTNPAAFPLVVAFALFTTTGDTAVTSDSRDPAISDAPASGPFTPVPEPTAALLGALGMIALLWRRR